MYLFVLFVCVFGHLLVKANLLALQFVMFSCVFLTFPYGVLGQLLYMIY